MAQLLINFGADIFHQDKLKRSPIHYAAAVGSLISIQILLKNAKKKEDKLRLLLLENVGKETPAKKAQQYGHTELVEFIES